MKLSHFVTAGLVTVVVALAGNLFVAPYNSEAYETLHHHKVRLENNLEDLKRRQAELRSTIELLTRSSDAVRVEARSLGLYDEGETVVRIEEMHGRTRSLSPGSLIARPVPESGRRGLVRVVAGLAGLMTLLGLVLGGGTHRQREIRRASR